MKSAKQEVKRMLERIPSVSTLEGVQYHIYVREKTLQVALKVIWTRAALGKR